MNIEVKRRVFHDVSTIGDMTIDGAFECHTLEDIVRPAGVKVDGATAIPSGTYTLVIDWSNRFQRRMPHVLSVPGFSGIRIHSGNTAADTEGCILVGTAEGQDWIGNSRVAFAALFPKIEAAISRGEAVTIVVT